MHIIRNYLSLAFLTAALPFLFLAGCSRAPVLQFAPSETVAELPEKHQESIRDRLRLLFGTPVDPRLREIDPDAEEPEEDEESEVEQIPQLLETAKAEHLKHGARVYNARCAGCHGVTGDGKGPAGEYLRPRPRDYTQGVFKFTSTPYGGKPARHDLVRTIRRGAKGTSMPAFPWMSDEDLNAVIDYVMLLSRRGEVENYAALMSEDYEIEEALEFAEFADGLELSIDSWNEAEEEVVLPVTAEPTYDEDSVREGRLLFLSKGCSKCHGEDGKGQMEWINPEFLATQEALPDEKKAQINYDRWGEPAPAADLTARMLHGGRRPIDIYRRIYTGINGTPMPAFEDMFAEDPESIWLLVHYVRHVIEGGDPTAGIPTLPSETTDEASDQESTSDDATSADTDADSDE